MTSLPETARLRELAAEVTALQLHYGAANEPAAIRRRMVADWLDDLREFETAIVAEACREWRRTQTRRPLPADIRTLCIAAQRDAAERQAITDERARRWPQWLADLWGPEPEGPRRRAEFQRANVTKGNA